MRISVFFAAFLFLTIGCSTVPHGTSAVGTLPESESFDVAVRDFPSFALSNNEEILYRTGFKPSPSDVTKTSLNPPEMIDAKVVQFIKPYAFTKAESAASSMGKIYYSPGRGVPEVLWNYGHSPTPSGDWVFFIQPPGTSPPGPARINVYTREVEYLDTSLVDPPCNYLVPADDGNAYIYGAMNPMDRMGWIYIVKNGEMVFSVHGSYLFPVLSADASTAAWCYDPTPYSFGARHPYVMDIATGQTTQIHTCSISEEAQWIRLSEDGSIAGFTVIIDGPDGFRDQEAWRYENGSCWKLDAHGYRWCHTMSMSPDGKYQAWSANQDPYEYAGYAVQCYLQETGDSVVVTPWNSQIQDIWPDVDSNGRIIFGHGVGYWSHYIPSLTHVDTGIITTLYDPGGISRDFKFKR